MEPCLLGPQYLGVHGGGSLDGILYQLEVGILHIGRYLRLERIDLAHQLIVPAYALVALIVRPVHAINQLGLAHRSQVVVLLLDRADGIGILVAKGLAAPVAVVALGVLGPGIDVPGQVHAEL